MRSFSKFIAEGRGPHTTDQSRATDNGVNTSDVQNPRALRALNAYVGAIANMEYILPEHALTKLRNALDRVGYSFGAIPEMTEEVVHLIYHLQDLVVDLEKTLTHHMMK